ncbi:hypothetical protein CCR85_05975 [Rhodothalassium salexigens]|uniref:S41 family peptidase n=1 Tax=Rhodothalassium salexigens TaxID=1086 RepID=UPI0019116442|nr:S41 family peptidase [Rhodothalassium salexigens]MBK5911037.1 hypothetical protein [Rhodothalassium salexigens]MBK5920412.1 hypothetical protein [Rhodothalassium salexigens]
MRTGFFAVTLSALLTLGLALPGAAETDKKGFNTYQDLNRFVEVFEKIRAEYVEEVDDGEVLEAAINGMLRSLDPHSSYMGPETFQNMQVQTEGEYGGLGMEVTMEDGVVKVVSPIDDTPAERAGIQGGDYITHIDGEAITDTSLTKAVRRMRGPIGQSVIITVVRQGVDEPFDVEIVRDKIRLASVDYRVERGNIGYIRISSFNEKTTPGLKDALSGLKADLGDDLAGVVLDLRDNPGGLLNEAISVSDMFLDQGEIVSTRGRRPSDRARWNATPGDRADGVPVVVLVNPFSASASEIVAGALQDHRRATILGERTFGKGTVQTVLRLDRESAIRLTTGRYYTPSNRSIQERGIEPDIEVLQTETSGRRVRREEDLAGHLVNENGPLKPAAAEALKDAAGDGEAPDGADTGGDDTTDAPDAEATGADEPHTDDRDADAPAGDQVAAETAPEDSEPVDRQLERALDLLQGTEVALSNMDAARIGSGRSTDQAAQD